jgi:hypothetical protein
LDARRTDERLGTPPDVRRPRIDRASPPAVAGQAKPARGGPARTKLIPPASVVTQGRGAGRAASAETPDPHLRGQRAASRPCAGGAPDERAYDRVTGRASPARARPRSVLGSLFVAGYRYVLELADGQAAAALSRAKNAAAAVWRLE